MPAPATATSDPSPPTSSAVLAGTLLRYTLSLDEYALLHRSITTRAPSQTLAATLKKRLPSTVEYQALVDAGGAGRSSPSKGFNGEVTGGHEGGGDDTAAAVRASLRIFAGTWVGLGLWEGIKRKLLSRRQSQTPVKIPTLRSPNFRLSLSLSTILLLHRLLYRFLSTLRKNLLTPDARPFRVRNPRVSRLLVSRLAPAVGASLAGVLLGVYPADQLRVTIAIYALTRAAEFSWNKLESEGWARWRPWWFGSWLLFPVSCGQLLHAVVFDRDCFPATFGDFILKNSGEYIQRRPDGYPASLPWPSTYEMVDNLAMAAKMKYPPFVSPILFPNATSTLPQPLAATAPVVDPAHPAIKHLTCAMLHPHDPSCSRTYITYYIQAFPALARFVAILYTALSLPRYRTFWHHPLPSLDKLSRRILRTTLFMTGAIGTSWASICFFQHLLPRGVLPTQRFFVGGFLGGLWAFLERHNGRGQFTYAARLSVDSAWQVARKRRWVRPVKNGDVWVFVAGLAVINAVYELEHPAVDSAPLRRALGFARGGGFVDPVGGAASKDLKEGDEDGEGEVEGVVEGESAKSR